MVTLGVDTTQCGGTVTLDAQNIGSTYLWSDNSTAQTLVVIASGTYSVSVTAPNGCSANDAINVTINTVPVVNIGSRQNKRDRGTNIMDVKYERTEIINAIKYWLEKGKATTSNVYGGGNAGYQIAEQLATMPLRFHKTISY